MEILLCKLHYQGYSEKYPCRFCVFDECKRVRLVEAIEQEAERRKRKYLRERIMYHKKKNMV